jgi:hypothetical protein
VRVSVSATSTSVIRSLPQALRPQARHPGARWRAWLLQGLSEQKALHPGPHRTPHPEQEGHRWWRVTALVVGLLSPLAILALIALTL